MLKKFIAFSLAEVLMVIGVIGIVATLALPSLNSNVEERKCISALRKIYPELENAYQNIIEQYGRPFEWGTSNADSNKMTDHMNNFISQNLSVLKNCGRTAGECFPSYGVVKNNTLYSKLLLKDGSSLALYLEGMSTILSNVASSEYSNGCHGYMGQFIVDVNGAQGENKIGYDIFRFKICSEEGLFPEGDGPAGPNASADSGTAWALKAGNRDYLKCNDLSWDSKRTCK